MINDVIEATAEDLYIQKKERKTLIINVSFLLFNILSLQMWCVKNGKYEVWGIHRLIDTDGTLRLFKDAATIGNSWHYSFTFVLNSGQIVSMNLVAILLQIKFFIHFVYFYFH